jgi:hypothetical protein
MGHHSEIPNALVWDLLLFHRIKDRLNGMALALGRIDCFAVRHIMDPVFRETRMRLFAYQSRPFLVQHDHD